MILESIQGLIADVMREVSALPGLPRKANIYHERIVEAIQYNDPDAACRLLKEHLLHGEGAARSCLYSG
jgi:DNA-binding FadR family transcriptional regulator